MNPNPLKVVVLEPYSAASTARLTAAGHSVVSDLAAADVALIRSRTRVDRAFLDRAPRLRLIVTATSGFDHIDWRETRARGLTAAHTPEANAQSTAELTLTLLLAYERQLLTAAKNVRESLWREHLARPAGLDGRTFGIVGLGRVGSRVARMAAPFGLKLLAYDPYVEDDRFRQFGTQRSGFIELLRASDFVTLHVPLTKETRHLLNNPTFRELGPDAVLINTCRGPVVDENDLMSALDDGVIAGAAMDVIEREPPPAGHRLLTHPRLLLTPHIGAHTQSAWERASMEAVEKILTFSKGESLADTLPLTTPWFEKT